MPGELNYAYDLEQVVGLHLRVLRIYKEVIQAADPDEAIKPNLYNSILNMVANVTVSPVALAAPRPLPGTVR